MLMTVASAVGIVLRTKLYGFLALGLFVPLLLIYLFTLPATYTGGVVGLISLRYLNTELIFFSIALAGFLSLTLSLNIYAFRASVLGRGRGLGVGAIFAMKLVITRAPSFPGWRKIAGCFSRPGSGRKARAAARPQETRFRRWQTIPVSCR